MKTRFTHLCLIATILLTGLCPAARAVDIPEPVADPASIVASGNMRFTVLTSRMIRIEQSNSKKFEDRATFAIVNRLLPVPSFSTETQGGYLYIKTEALTLKYLIGSTPRLSDRSPKNLSVTFSMGGTEQTWFPGKDDAQNLMGTTRTLDRAWGDAQRDALERGLLSRAGWAIVDDSPAATRGDGSRSFPLAPNEEGFPWWQEPADRQATDWYFMGYGHDYKAALRDFTRVAGRIPMPPKYIFGYWYSRYWAYSQSDFIGLVSDVERYDVPIDVMIMDMDWHKSGWTGWSWNTSLIPNPTYLIDYFHRHGLRTALNLHPADGIANYEDGYGTIRKELGYPTTFTDRIPWRLDDYDFYKSFFKNIMRLREKEGVDFWWLDWQQWLTSPYTDGLGETFWLNHVYYTDMERNRTDRRPVIYHRWGGLGSHRYPIAFSGDTFAEWSTLGYEIPFTAMASNVCYAYWGHDLGGHQGGTNDPELLQRWLQFGAYSPIFRTHATNDSRLERRIWKYRNFTQLRETVRLRYRLFPYLYTAAREAYETGVGICRPLYYDWPEAQEAYTREDEYMFGGDMLVAPIYTPSTDGVSRRTVWLPEGRWWDVTQGELKQGPYTREEEFTTDEFPVYYRAGSVIPNYPTRRTVQQTPDTIVLYVVPGADGEGRFYEDEGDSQAYREGACANTRFRQTWTPTQTRLVIEPREGQFAGMPQERAWRIVFLGLTEEPKSVECSLGNGEWTMDDLKTSKPHNLKTSKPHNLKWTMDIAKGDCNRRIEVTVEYATALSPVNEPDAEAEPLVYAPTEAVSGQLYISGEAVPGGVQMLEPRPDGTFAFHGTLFAGSLYISNTERQKGTTRYCKPGVAGADVVTRSTAYSTGYGATGAEWDVAQRADNYRFTVDPTSLTLRGELFTQWYEAWIVGGCTAAGQRDGWALEKGLAMEQSPTDPNEWRFVGLLRAYAGNEQANRFKINGQYDWNPKALHPYDEGTDIVDSQKARYGNQQDLKWTISRDGYYRITANCFLETVTGEYLGDTLPDGIEGIMENGQWTMDNGQWTMDDAIYDLSGRQLSNGKSSNGKLSNCKSSNCPLTRGIYIKNGKKYIINK